MSAGSQLAIGAAGLLVAESTGATNVTPIGATDDGPDFPELPSGGGGVSGDAIASIASAFAETARAGSGAVESGGVGGVSELADAIADSYEAGVEAGAGAASDAAGGGGGFTADQIIDAITAGVDAGAGAADEATDRAGDGGGYVDQFVRGVPGAGLVNRDGGAPFTVGLGEGVQLVDVEPDPTGVLATKDDLRGRLSAWESEQTGEGAEFVDRVVGGENPVGVAADVGDGPIGFLARRGENPFDPDNIKKSAGWWANVGPDFSEANTGGDRGDSDGFDWSQAVVGTATGENIRDTDDGESDAVSTTIGDSYRASNVAGGDASAADDGVDTTESTADEDEERRRPTGGVL